MASDAENSKRVRLRTFFPSFEDSVTIVNGYRIVDLPLPPTMQEVGSPRPDRSKVFFDDEVYQEMLRHLGHDIRFEVGGFLLGYRCRVAPTADTTFVQVTGFVPATHGEGTVIAFNITPEDLFTADAAIDERGKQEQFIGWVHSHPHHDPAPSPPDRFNMEHYFQQFPEQFTFIANPNTNQAGVFRFEDGTSVNQGGFYLVGTTPRHGLYQLPHMIRINNLGEAEKPRVRIIS